MFVMCSHVLHCNFIIMGIHISVIRNVLPRSEHNFGANQLSSRISFYSEYMFDFNGHSLPFSPNFRLSVTKYIWLCSTPFMFLPLDILLEYWIGHVTFGLLCVMFTFPARIFYRGVPGSATDSLCGVWCGGLTTCPLYVVPLFGNLV